MQAVHAVQPGWADWPGDDTVVCRCEEVTLGRMRAAAGLGADDARSIKLLARPGMGWCQGRICGPTVDALLAAGLGPAPAEGAARPADVGAAGQPSAEPGAVGQASARPASQPPAEPGTAGPPAAESGPVGQAGGPTLSRPLAQPVPLGVLARLAGLDEPSGAGAARPDPGGTAGAGTAGTGTAEAGAGETGAAPDDEGKM